MAPEKRNAFLDAGDSDDDNESQGYNSDADEVQKGGVGGSNRNAKRRRTSEESESDDEDRITDAQHSRKQTTAAKSSSSSKRRKSSDDEAEEQDDDVEEDDDDDEDRDAAADALPELPDITRLTKKNLVATEKAVKKSGLVYISRVPPFMKPQKLRSLLDSYGTINRIFLSPEDPAAHTRRVKAGGNKKRNFTDGWVEFTDKKDAKTVVSMLNARTIGGAKGSYYRDDVWSMIYLKGFKWHNLTEQIASEAAERTSRIRAEITKATKENKDFVRNIERAKVMDGMEAKTAAKKKSRADGDDVAVSGGGGGAGRAGEQRKFKQATAGKQRGEKAPEETKRVLSKLF
ncbi:ESF2/ABP1 family protein [Microdochium nivale]|nr:ESF2/ABP1 family protein [Microdochium nivale]